MSETFNCHFCNTKTARELPGFERFHQVTSDCRPWKAGGRLGVCDVCSVVQKATDAAWRSGVESIYGDYQIYSQGQGAEQVIFDQTSGGAIPRSRRLIELIQQVVGKAPAGRMLDIGCGNGAMLRAFGAAFPGWTMVGVDRSDRHRSEIENIPGVEAFYDDDPLDVPRDFDLITIIHVLEHIVAPLRFLHGLREKLIPDGQLLIQVPDFRTNPFELLVADHCTHFVPSSLTSLLEAAGFHVSHQRHGWVPKELTAIAERRNDPTPKTTVSVEEDSYRDAERAVAWLAAVARMAREAADNGPLAVFGTSIAGTWLFNEVGGKIELFVDEDPNRVGRTYLGRPIRSPRQVPDGLPVVVPLAPVVSRPLVKRLRGLGLRLLLPPDAQPAA